jgi:hypothetical protein
MTKRNIFKEGAGQGARKIARRANQRSGKRKKKAAMRDIEGSQL